MFLQCTKLTQNDLINTGWIQCTCALGNNLSLSLQRAQSPSPLRPCNSWKKQNRHSLDATATKAFHPCTGLPLLSSPVRHTQIRLCTWYFHAQFYRHIHTHTGLALSSSSCVCHNTTLTHYPILFSIWSITLSPFISLELGLWMFVIKCLKYLAATFIAAGLQRREMRLMYTHKHTNTHSGVWGTWVICASSVKQSCYTDFARLKYSVNMSVSCPVIDRTSTYKQ